ncbi:MAG: TraR/DksA C4-type zinc finger protein [Nitrospira sp.]|nr:TraR/DksA C4-type zinc finger protein [bacterium]MBL7048088.1 TraR/DksA C4-type zinc finger protein [Nitrospira sp.]
MNSDDKNRLRELIIKEIDSLKETIAVLKETINPITPDDAIGRLTRMEAINAKSISESTYNSARLKLGKLQKSLEIFNSPEFGLCSQCGEDIPVKRLMAVPESKMCVPCINELS